MNKIHTIYKSFLLIIFALFCTSPAVLGQVYGNKYTDKKQVKLDPVSYTVPVNSSEADLANADFIHDDNTTEGKDIQMSWSRRYSYYWTDIVLKLDNEQRVNRIKYYTSSIDPNKRPTELIIYGRNNTYNSWNEITTKTNLSNSSEVEITNINSNYRYIKLEFYSGKQPYIQLNEIDLYTETVQTELAQIISRPAKWHGERKGTYGDTFDSRKFFTITNPSTNQTHDVQATHTYMETIYVHRGQSVILSLPDRNGDELTMKSYQRWYNFLTGGTFATGRSGTNEINDLLTPVLNDPASIRYENGYLGPISKSVSAGKMNFYFPENNEFDNLNDDVFVVACDVSSYLDKKEDENSYTEPTIPHRILYQIICVDGRGENWNSEYNNLTKLAYQGGGNAEGKKYLEEYEIHYPFTRVSNYTKELVALANDGRSYAIPRVSSTSDNNTLDVKIDGNTNTAGITLVNTSVSDNKRVVQFDYPEKNNDNYYGIQSVNSVTTGHPEATILVTKTVNRITYNIARFHLIFDEEGTSMMTQSMLKDYDTKTDEVLQSLPWGKYRFRTPKYLEQNYHLLTKLDWDYENENVALLDHDSNYYPFPMGWNHSSYGFYDGSTAGWKNDNKIPEWGMYGIMKGFVPFDNRSNPQPLHNKGYHLYVDASDRPGNIVRLPFKQSLCPGSELFVTAMVKSASAYWYGQTKTNQDDAGLLFTVLGVNKDELGNIIEQVPIYRQASGQVRHTEGLKSAMPGCGPNTNEWFQLYFSFINSSNLTYEDYILQIDNYSASTTGADFYLDDIRVYMENLEVKVEQLQASCGTSDILMSAKLNWDQLESRRGTENTDAVDRIDFCIIDEAKYQAYKQAYPDCQVVDAIRASLVEFTAENKENPTKLKMGTLWYHTNFDKNKYDYETYKQGHMFNALPKKDTDGKYYFYTGTDAITNERYLAIDFISGLQANRPYKLLIAPPQDVNHTVGLADFVGIDDACALSSSFWVTSSTYLKANGEIVNPNTEFCVGQLFKFTAVIHVPVVKVDEGGNVIEETYVPIKNQDTYFDWFFGTEDEFLAKESGTKLSLQEALDAFRKAYPSANELSEQNTPVGTITSPIDKTQVDFTKQMYDLLLNYVNSGKLLLRQHNMDIRLTKNIDLVLSPIMVIVDPDKYDNQFTTDDLQKVCLEYIPLTLRLTPEAPTVNAGFNSVAYPKMTYPNLRIGLDQITKAAGAGGIKINLRKDVTFASTSPNSIGTMTDRDFVYLVDSDDPNPSLRDILDDPSFDRFTLPIGKILELKADKNSLQNSMTLKFDLNGSLVQGERPGFKFEPREGYTYTLLLPFEEKLPAGVTGDNICYGMLTIDMKVVPEYMYWSNTDGSGSWNVDNNWFRADKDRLLKPSGDSYKTNAANTTNNGFVPLLFSKVILPAGSHVDLPLEGFNSAKEWASADPQLTTSDEVKYDMMAFNTTNPFNQNSNDLITKPYRVNLANQVHIEAGAELSHPEYLLYDKAWIEYGLQKGRWYTLASPLKDVVAGDFYTDTNGKEKSELFQPITYSTKDNNRFNPAVYQRGWNNSSMMYLNGTPDSKDMAIQGNWSGLYNDVTVPYSGAEGFSLKVQGTGLTSDSAYFRLPKNDTRYTYYTNTGAESGDSPEISRTNAYRLKADALYQRDYSAVKWEKVAGMQADAQAAATTKISVALSETAGGNYYLVANPFTSHLDVEKFFTQNTAVIEPKYWLVTNSNQNVLVGTDGHWVDNTTAATDKNIAPLQSFFVKKKAEATSNNLDFTADMQVLGAKGAPVLKSAAGSQLLITASTAEGVQSRAVVVSDLSASDTFKDSEDAELFLDSNLGGVPMVYTVAGTMAATINRTASLYNIPLGVYGKDGEEVTLTFTGLQDFSSAVLYDAVRKEETSLYEGYTVQVPANTNGRYFLCVGNPTGNEEIEVEDIRVFAIANSELLVSSTGLLETVTVYDAAGRVVAHTDHINDTTYRRQLPVGLYVVKVKVKEKSRTVKVRI